MRDSRDQPAKKHEAVEGLHLNATEVAGSVTAELKIFGGIFCISTFRTKTMRTKVLYLVLGCCFASSNPAMAEERANFQVTCDGNVRVEPPPGKRCQSLRITALQGTGRMLHFS